MQGAKQWQSATDPTLVCEPTSMNIGIVHMGFVWIKIETIRKAAHGSVADLGRTP